jgi:hypothetical protein
MNQAVPRLARKRISRFDRLATIIVQYRNREFVVKISTDILDDMDRTDHKTDAAMEQSFDRHLNRILVRAARAIDAGRAGDAELLILTDADFPEVG